LKAWQVGAERRRLRRAFDGAVSPAVLKEILAGRLNPKRAGERREICVLFSDIRNFTSLSEHLPPELVTDFLNRYFEHMAGAIHCHHGTLDKFIGDGIMAVFGAPKARADSCNDAFQAAQEMLRQLDAFNHEQLLRGGPQIAMGIGLHFGPALVGYIGSTDRYEYSAVGDTVNTASRLEGLTKELGYPVVLSAAVRRRLMAQLDIETLGTHPVKGHAPIEVFGWKP
jgi:class 3 adenylate cyclase